MDELRFPESNSGLIGHWRLDVYRGDEQTPENFVETIEGYNLVTTAGKGLYLDRLFGLGPAAVSRIGVGTSGTAAAVGDTALTGSAFKAFDTAAVRAGLTVTASATFGTADANFNWQELGMDNGGTLLNRIAPIGPFNKTSVLSLIVTVSLTQN